MESETLNFSAILLGAFLGGAAGSVHCLGMCGPIATLLGSQTRSPWRQFSYQLGRIGSYMLLAVAGAGALQLLSGVTGFQIAGQVVRVLLALTLILIGGYLLFGWRAIDSITKVGAGFWQRLRPLAGRFLPPRHAGHALLLGMIWGWLPCGMVYAMLSVAWTTADVGQAAATMAAFGLGTTPMMLGAAGSSAWLKSHLGQGGLRRLSGVLLLAAGLFSAYQFGAGLLGGGHHGHHGQHQQQASMSADADIDTESSSAGEDPHAHHH